MAINETDNPSAGRETLVLTNRQETRAEEPQGTELDCLEEVCGILDLARRERSPESSEGECGDQDDENAETQQLELAISDFYDRLSVDLPESPADSSLGCSSQPSDSDHVEPARNDGLSNAPYERRQAPESADVLSQLRNLARQSANEAIGQHTLNQSIAKAKRSLWMSSAAIFGACGLLQISWQQRPELNVAIWVMFAVAVGSTLNYCLLARRLSRNLRSFQPKS